MKFKTTKKSISSNYSRIIKISYCNAQYLLRYNEPIAYSTRSEGWACDYHEVDGVLISTGYAPIESKNTKSTYDIVRKYDDAASAIIRGNSGYEEIRQQVNDLLKQFVAEVSK